MDTGAFSGLFALLGGAGAKAKPVAKKAVKAKPAKKSPKKVSPVKKSPAKASAKKSSSRTSAKRSTSKKSPAKKHERLFPRVPLADKDAQGHWMMYIGEPWFTMIKEGLKKIELRIKVAKYAEIKAGDKVHIVSGHADQPTGKKDMIKTVTKVETFKTLLDVFKNHKASDIVPGAPSGICSLKASGKFLRREDQTKYGIVAFHLA